MKKTFKTIALLGLFVFAATLANAANTWYAAPANRFQVKPGYNQLTLCHASESAQCGRGNAGSISAQPRTPALRLQPYWIFPLKQLKRRSGMP